MKTRPKQHLTLAIGLAASVVLASCAQSGSAASPSSPPSVSPPASSTSTSTPTSASSPTSTTAATSSTPVGRRIEITVKGKKVSPAPGMVNIAVGESLTVGIISDHDDTLHAHGFEIEKAVKAGQRVEVTVKGAEPGVFEFELHHPELRLFQVAVR